MKKILVISILLAACTSHSQKESTAENAKDTTSVEAPVNLYKNIKFASPKDLNCGMPLSAGVEDTAHYKGKIYGFCSKECKDDFLKDPAKHLVAK
ncbi:MAG: YHS domain-containing protein [Ginsengibacter sp.]